MKMKAAELLEFTRMTGLMIKAIRDCPVPVIAAVNGIAAGAGSVVALASDFRLLADTASFAFLFTRVGLSGADMGAAYLLPRVVGLGRATELLMLGDKVTAQRAMEIGLATEVVPGDELRSGPTALARRLADGPALAYAATKTLISRETGHGPRERDRVRGLDAGAAHARRGPPRVLRGMDAEAPAEWRGR